MVLICPSRAQLVHMSYSEIDPDVLVLFEKFSYSFSSRYCYIKSHRDQLSSTDRYCYCRTKKMQLNSFEPSLLLHPDSFVFVLCIRRFYPYKYYSITSVTPRARCSNVLDFFDIVLVMLVESVLSSWWSDGNRYQRSQRAVSLACLLQR